MNMMNTGMVATEAPVMTISHCDWNSPLKKDNPTGNVYIVTLFDTINGHMKAFQLPMNEKIANAESAGSTRGMAMRDQI